MSNKNLFNQKEFPEWKGYNKITEEQLEYIKKLWLNDINLMAKTIYELTIREKYFSEMLLYIQRKMYLDEPLELCLNSAKEVFDIMITPCELVNDNGTEITLEDYDDVSEWTVEREDKDDPMSRQFMLCKTCDFATDNTFKFTEHSCGLNEE